MFKTKTAQRPFISATIATALLGLLAAANPTGAGAQSCDPSLGASLGIQGPYAGLPNYIHVGETASLNANGVSVFNGSQPGACTVTNLKSWLIYPNNSFQTVLVLNPSIIAPGGNVTCPSSGSCLSFSTTYVIQGSDVGSGLSFTTNWPPTLGGFTSTASGLPGKVLFQYAATGSGLEDATARAQASPSKALIVLQPCVSITKNCATNCTPYGQPIAFTGVITNCSFLQSTPNDGSLFITSVSDNPTAAITYAPTTLKGQPFNIANGGPLPQGDSIAYSGSYQPTGDLCGPFSDTITVIASDLTGFTVTNSASATCHVSTHPAIDLSKDCYKTGSPGVRTLVPGDTYVEVFVVSNTGDVALNNVVIHDDVQGDITIGSLAVGQSVTNTTSAIAVTDAQCGQSITDHATATGAEACPADTTCPRLGTVSSAERTCTVTVNCPPKICVNKGVICGPQGSNPQCDPNQTYLKSDTGVNGANFCYRIIVQNCGPVTLTNVLVSDSLLGTLSDFPTTLASGQTVTNTYSHAFAGNANGPTTTTNIVTVTGTGGSDTTGNAITTNATDNATATVVPIGVNCSITLNYAQDADGSANDNHVTLPASTVGALVGFNLTINNTGQADLSVSLSGVPSLVDCTTQNPITVPASTNVAAGQSITIDGCMLVDCPGISNNVAVQGTAIASATVPCVFDSNGNAITTTQSLCNASVNCQPAHPKICVTKEIKCLPASPLPNPVCDPNDTYFKTVTGVNGAAFCYRVIVLNCGDVTLTNVTVNDNNPLGSGSLDFSGCAPLAPGQTCTNTYFLSTPVQGGIHTNVNTVTACGIGNGETVCTNDHATNIVVPISVNCQLTLSSEFNLTNCPGANNQCQVVLPSSATSAPVNVTLVINNTGMADLNVAITGLPPLYDCDTFDQLSIETNALFVAAGDTVTITGCALVTCPGGLDMPIHVQGTAVASATVPCVNDANGNALKTSVSQCPGCVSCCQPVQCRVTGGGTLYEGDVSHNCIDVVTTLHSDLADEAGLVIDHISHGGQLGAPFNQMDCGERLNNPCIRGEWEHQRHYDNKNSGASGVFDANFHSANPNITGHFDTLLCGCLPCCYNGELYVGNNPVPPGWLNKKFTLCNPEDRRICGPLPRPAPANAIIFTGIGTFTPQASTGKGRKANARYVVFRVYIEDRSEPGGIHPGGAKMPGTVYCFQAWDTGQPVSKKGWDLVAEDFRRALGADSCAFMSAMQSTALPPGSLPSTTVAGVTADVYDQGALHNGSQQIHPSTGANPCTK